MGFADRQIQITIGFREIAVIVVGGTLEAAMWPQMEDAPHWLRNVHILIAAPLLVSLLLRTKLPWFKWAQALLVLTYLATIGYVLAYSKDLQEWISRTIMLSFPRYGWFAVGAAVIAIGVTVGLLLKSSMNARDLKSALDEIRDLKQQLTTAAAASALPLSDASEAAQIEKTAALLAGAPRVLVELSGANPQRPDIDGRLGELVFVSDKGAIIRNVGIMRSAERYESKYEFNLIPSTLPVVYQNRPAQCRMLGLRQIRDSPGTYAPNICALVDVLRDAAPQSVDSVVIDYDDEDGHEFSRRFSLTRNADDSVAWIPDPVVLRGNTRTPEPGKLDLAALRHEVYLAGKFPETYEAWQKCSGQLDAEKQRLSKIAASRSNFFQAAKLSLLAEDAEKLRDEYNSLMHLNMTDQNPMDLSRPMAAGLTEDGTPLAWQRRRLMYFREHYNRHSVQVRDVNAPGLESSPLLKNKLPNDLGESEVADVLRNHKTALEEKVAELARPYFEALNAQN